MTLSLAGLAPPSQGLIIVDAYVPFSVSWPDHAPDETPLYVFVRETEYELCEIKINPVTGVVSEALLVAAVHVEDGTLDRTLTMARGQPILETDGFGGLQHGEVNERLSVTIGPADVSVGSGTRRTASLVGSERVAFGLDETGTISGIVLSAMTPAEMSTIREALGV